MVVVCFRRFCGVGDVTMLCSGGEVEVEVVGVVVVMAVM